MEERSGCDCVLELISGVTVRPSDNVSENTPALKNSREERAAVVLSPVNCFCVRVSQSRWRTVAPLLFRRIVANSVSTSTLSSVNWIPHASVNGLMEEEMHGAYFRLAWRLFICVQQAGSRKAASGFPFWMKVSMAFNVFSGSCSGCARSNTSTSSGILSQLIGNGVRLKLLFFSSSTSAHGCVARCVAISTPPRIFMGLMMAMDARRRGVSLAMAAVRSYSRNVARLGSR